MALGDIMVNFSELVANLPVEVSDKVLGLILVLKTLSIAAIIYIGYVIVIGILTYRKMKKLDHIQERVDSIDKKMSKLLKIKRKN